MEMYYNLFFMSLTLATVIVGGLLLRIYLSINYQQVCVLK